MIVIERGDLSEVDPRRAGGVGGVGGVHTPDPDVSWRPLLVVVAAAGVGAAMGYRLGDQFGDRRVRTPRRPALGVSG